MLVKNIYIKIKYSETDAADSIGFYKDLLYGLSKALDYNVLRSSFYKFKPQGVTGILLLSESHMSIHTWPEKKFAIFEMVTCRRFGLKEKNLLLKKLADILHAGKMEVTINK